MGNRDREPPPDAQARAAGPDAGLKEIVLIAVDRRETRLVGRSRLTSASSNTCAVNRAGSGNRLPQSIRRRRSNDQAEPVASARATRSSSGRG